MLNHSMAVCSRSRMVLVNRIIWSGILSYHADIDDLYRRCVAGATDMKIHSSSGGDGRRRAEEIAARWRDRMRRSGSSCWLILFFGVYLRVIVAKQTGRSLPRR